MRILAVNKFHYRRGGAETVYLGESELLREHGHYVVPFAMQHPKNETTPYARHFVTNVELRDERGSARDKLMVAGRLLYSREAAQKLEALLRHTQPDVAHLHNVYHQLSPSILRVLAKHRIPTVMTMHDYKLICPAYTLYTHGAPCERCKGGAFYNATLQSCVKNSRGKSLLCTAEAYLHRALGLYRRNVAAFIAPSRFLAAKAAEFGMDATRITYIPNFVDTSDSVAAAPGQAPYLLYAGRLEGAKGVATLIEAFGRSAAKSNHDLVVAGDGEERSRFEGLAEQTPGRIRFTGHLAPAALQGLIDGASFVVAPSEWYENAPLSVLEAAGRGKAVVVTDIGGLPELVRPGETGLVVPPRDPAALARAIEELASDPARTAEMGRAARTFVKETFSAERHYGQLMALYEKVLSPAPHQETAM